MRWVGGNGVVWDVAKDKRAEGSEEKVSVWESRIQKLHVKHRKMQI